MNGIAENEFSELSGNYVVITVLASERVRVCDFGNGENRHRTRKTTAPLIDVVERPRVRTVGVQLM